MRLKNIVYESLNAELGAEFDRYVVDHPDFAARIPRRAVVILQLEGDPGFNRWVKRISLKHVKGEKPVVYVKVKGLMPVQSRLKKPVSLEVAA